jgi:hypothetical protein
MMVLFTRWLFEKPINEKITFTAINIMVSGVLYESMRDLFI